MTALLMTMRPTPKIPAMAAFLAGCIALIGIVFIQVAAQTAPAEQNAMAISKDVFSWVIGFSGVVMLLLGIVYGFVKKQKYDNLETTLDEWKGIAEGREERIKELKYSHGEETAKYKLQIETRDRSITNLQESNGALVSQSLQMKAILRELRMSGQWQGHEDRIHETK